MFFKQEAPSSIKNALFLSVNVFSTKGLIGDTNWVLIGDSHAHANMRAPVPQKSR